MLSVPVTRLASADEPFVAHRHAGAGWDGVEAVGDGRLSRALQWMLLEFSRHDKLARRIDLGEFAAPAVGTAVCEDDDDAPLTAYAQVRLPLRPAVEVGVSPPAIDLVRSERSKDAVRRCNNLRGRDDCAAPSVRHRTRRAPFRCGRHPEISLRLACYLFSQTWSFGKGRSGFDLPPVKESHR